jgi:hypothetical protein
MNIWNRARELAERDEDVVREGVLGWIKRIESAAERREPSKEGDEVHVRIALRELNADEFQRCLLGTGFEPGC